MVYTCCVSECNTGYKTNKTTEKVALFKFLGDSNLKLQWFKAIDRQDWYLMDSHRVCAKHFSAEDFITASHDHQAE